MSGKTKSLVRSVFVPTIYEKQNKGLTARTVFKAHGLHAADFLRGEHGRFVRRS